MIFARKQSFTLAALIVALGIGTGTLQVARGQEPSFRPSLADSAVWTAATLPKSDGDDLRVTPIPSIDHADAFANELIRANQPVLILHVGDYLPAQLKWILAILDLHKIPYTAKLVTPQELGEAVDREVEGVRVVLKRATPSQFVPPAPKSVSFLRKVFGFPEGATMWFRFDRSLVPGLSDAARSLGDGVATALSIYSGKAMGLIEGDLLIPMVSITAWAMFNSGLANYFNRFMSAGRSIEVVGRTLKSRDNYLYSISLGTFRAFLTNLVVFFSFHGLGWFDDPELIGDFVRSGFATPLARVAVDMYLRDRQPGLLGDGGSSDRPTMNKWIWSALFVTWNIAVGSLRAADALGNNGAMYAHGALAIAGFVFLVARTQLAMRRFGCEWTMQGFRPLPR